MTRLLSGRCASATIETVVLLTSELVANAFLHASPPIHLRSQISDTIIRVEIHDTSPTAPTQKRAGPTDVTGRGIAIIDALATRWGTRGTDTGKYVWFELAYP